jgi:alanine-glyoxylate transaminase/serine-glyoxylate transaminase/serine-pyruvate transaminase
VNEGSLPELNPPVRTLLGPGPSATHPRVYKAMTSPVIGHLDPAYLQIMDEVQEMLRAAFRTRNRMTIALPGTGTSGMEAAMANLLEPGDTMVVGVAGYFGERIVEMAGRYGANVVRVDSPWGTPVDPDAIRRAVRTAGRVKAIAIVQGETSTGVYQPVEEIARIAHEAGALVIVDAVTSFCTAELDTGGWDLDFVYSCTQKGLSCPPGLAPITVSDRAMQAIHARGRPPTNWYLDLTLLEKYWGPERVYHHTAPASMTYALYEGLRLVLEEGIGNRVERHKKHAAALYAACGALGLGLQVAPEYRLAPLTTVQVPDGVDEAQVRGYLLKERGIEIGSGLGSLKGKVWRVGLMGYSSTAANVLFIVGALGAAIAEQSKSLATGSGLEAAASVLFA